jgi:hypothetical protein
MITVHYNVCTVYVLWYTYKLQAWGNKKTRTPGPWSTFVDLFHVHLHSCTTSHGPLSWTTRETPNFGGLNFWLCMGKCAWENVLESSSVTLIMIVETLHMKCGNEQWDILHFESGLEISAGHRSLTGKILQFDRQILSPGGHAWPVNFLIKKYVQKWSRFLISNFPKKCISVYGAG